MTIDRQLQDYEKSHDDDKKKYIRGVNLGGWLMAERFITPYLFAVNSCHLQGSLCWYPGQTGAPKRLSNSSDIATNNTMGPPEDPYRHSIHTLCDPTTCQPVQPVRIKEPNDYHERGWRAYFDYPVDEYTLGQTLRTSVGGLSMAQTYMERHWDTFLTFQDLKDLKAAGVTHLRIPMSYWIRGDLKEGEPYIPGGWPYFVRAAKWCRTIGGLTIWADLHGAPGSENGFDNSGNFKGVSSCEGWDRNPVNVQRTVDILTDIAQAIAQEGLQDVVTGFGVLNEPFVDCNEAVVRNYYNQALNILRSTLGDHISVFVGDTFRAVRFNDGFWTDPEIYHDTYLDSHPYHVFFEQGRAFTPRQHIAYVCRHDTNDVKLCCYEDPPNNTIPSRGISRIIGEWSAAYDTLPTAMTPFIMKHIETTGRAPFLNRTLSTERREFLRNFVEAQMIAYEAHDEGVSSGWLFWNFKMEGGAFAEWDFLRGVEEKWMPPIPHPTIPSQDVYGSCLDIYNRTNDDYAIVEEFPDPRTLDWNQWQGWGANDDFVMSDPNIPDVSYGPSPPWYRRSWVLPMFLVLACFVVLKLRWFASSKRRVRLGYTELKV
ncbi:cellulase glycosyl hydrolase family 5 protein [Nitzschia inconspicua]|uniref:glucan 1,3-beta-glucosidase n=1 Tax=Nitzschia inconspicua TaxID=303405 RepID=A0A9K3PHI7_9STRA|nr:cellulase glycosyl hydrolase family 5 protein [Nitzschia inconspicua]